MGMSSKNFPSAKKRRILIASVISCIIIVFFAVYILSINQTRDLMLERYSSGIAEIDAHHYQEGIDILSKLGNYKNCIELIEYAEKGLAYDEAQNLFNNQEYELAAQWFEQLGDFEDSRERAVIAKELAEKKRLDDDKEELDENIYNEAYVYYEEGKYVEALELLNTISNYSDSRLLAQTCRTALKQLMLSDTISAGIRYSASVTPNGAVNFVGLNFDGADAIESWTDIISIAVGGEFTVGLKRDGTAVLAKIDETYDYSLWSDIVEVAVGEQFAVGLKSDGTVLAKGTDGYGETKLDDWTDIVQIDTGWQHTVGLDKYGKVHAAGFIVSPDYSKRIDVENDINNDPKWTNIIAIATGGSTAPGIGRGHIVALKDDGTVVAIGDNQYSQCEVSDWKNIVSISAGAYHTVGLTSDGYVYTSQSDKEFPESVAEIKTWTDIVAVSAGYGFTLGLKADGTVVAAGLNYNGQWDTEMLKGADIHKEYWRLIGNETYWG